MPELNTITDPNLPEPKGISTASSDRVYVSDGLGSGNWFNAYQLGWEDYNDSGSTQSLTSGSWVDLTNDGAGANTNVSNRLPGAGAVWNTTNNEFNWANAGLSVGDLVGIRFDYSITTNNINDGYALSIDFSHGSGGEFKLIIDEDNLDTSGVHQLTRYSEFYIGSSEVLNNPAKVSMLADTAGDSVVVNGWFIKIHPRRIIYSVS